METPVTIPLDEPSNMVGSDVDHVPPGVASARVMDGPRHALSEPDIAAGFALTVTGLLDTQPVPVNLYVMSVLPDATPVTAPVEEPTVATLALPLIHVPPGSESANVMTLPTHTVDGPVGVAGNGFTVMTEVILQPVEPMV